MCWVIAVTLVNTYFRFECYEANENIQRISWLDGSRRLRSYPQSSCDYSSQPVSFVLGVDLFFGNHTRIKTSHVMCYCRVLERTTSSWQGCVSQVFLHAPSSQVKKEGYIGQVDLPRLKFLEERLRIRVLRNFPSGRALTLVSSRERPYLMSRKSDTIFGQGTIPEPSTSHIGKGGAGCPDSSFRNHIRQNLSSSRNDTQLLRNI